MPLGFKTPEDPNMAISPASYYDALKDERRRLEESGSDRVSEVDAELKKAGPAAVRDLRAALTQLEARGDSRARGVQADIERIEAEMGKAPKVERAANTQGGDAGASRAAS
jgi:hypothetical protein